MVVPENEMLVSWLHSVRGFCLARDMMSFHCMCLDGLAADSRLGMCVVHVVIGGAEGASGAVGCGNSAALQAGVRLGEHIRARVRQGLVRMRVTGAG